MWRPSGLSSPRRDKWPPAFTSTVRRSGSRAVAQRLSGHRLPDQGDVDLRTRLDGDGALQHYGNASGGQQQGSGSGNASGSSRSDKVNDEPVGMANVATIAAVASVQYAGGASITVGNNRIEVTKLPLWVFCRNLERYSDRQIIDITGLTGTYTFVVQVMPEDYMAMMMRSARSCAARSSLPKPRRCWTPVNPLRSATLCSRWA
jgi:Protein of unknown function (DUF3738)